MLAAFFSTHTLDHLLSNYGYAAVGAFVMIESLGVPFPGETMLITAALYAGLTHKLDVWGVWAAAAAGAIIGDNIGYGVGHWGGYRLLVRYGPKVRLDETKVKVGRLVFDRHGGKVVFFGRFVSILRTYAAFLAGTMRMHWLRFFFFNASGGIVWSGIFALAFYYAGNGLKKARGPVDVTLGVAAAIAVVAFIVWLRRNERRLEQQAERAYPGPLAAHMGTQGPQPSDSEERTEDSAERATARTAARAPGRRS
jgi:membrane protein DedA with SNARE-associated domain